MPESAALASTTAVMSAEELRAASRARREAMLASAEQTLTLMPPSLQQPEGRPTPGGFKDSDGEDDTWDDEWKDPDYDIDGFD